MVPGPPELMAGGYLIAADDVVALNEPQDGVQVDGDADVVGYDPDAVADARVPTGAVEVEQAMFFRHRLDDDVRAVEESAIPARIGRAQFLAVDGFRASIDDGLAGNGGTDDGRDDRVGAIVPCAGVEEGSRAIIEHVRPGPHLGLALDPVRGKRGRCGPATDDGRVEAGVAESIEVLAEVAGQLVECGRLLGDGLADVAGIERDPVEADTTGGSSLAGECDDILGPGQSNPVHAEVDLDENAEFPAGSCRGAGKAGQSRFGIERDPDIDAGWKRTEPFEASVADGRVRDQQTACKGRHDFCFLEGRAGHAGSAALELFRSEFARLVRLDVRAKCDAMRARVFRHSVEIRMHTVDIDDGCRRRQRVDRTGLRHVLVRGFAVSAGTGPKASTRGRSSGQRSGRRMYRKRRACGSERIPEGGVPFHGVGIHLTRLTREVIGASSASTRMNESFLVTLVGSGLLIGAAVAVLARRRKLARTLYRRKLELALADGSLTPDEVAELDKLREEKDLTQAEVRMVARAIYRRALRTALEDQRLTDVEDQNLRKLQMQLGLSETDLGDDGANLARLRLLGRVARGDLPIVDAPIVLVPNERAHWVVQASLAERLDLPRRTQSAIRAVLLSVPGNGEFNAAGERDGLRSNEQILPVDLGMLVITSRRTVFQGAKRTVSVPHARLETIALYLDGLRLDEISGASRGFLLVDDAELTAAILLRAGRRRREEIKPTRRGRSA